MSQMHNYNARVPQQDDADDLEQLLLHGTVESSALTPDKPAMPATAVVSADEDDEEVETPDNDLQGALGLFAEASQDMATAALELSLGRHFACADFCNQAVEKAAQAVSLLQCGHRSMYNHDLRALGALVGAPAAIQDEMAILTPFHPEAFYVDTPPEEADEVINAEQASSYIRNARTVLRWARSIVLNM